MVILLPAPDSRRVSASYMQKYVHEVLNLLALKRPINTAADYKFCDIFPNFPKK